MEGKRTQIKKTNNNLIKRIIAIIAIIVVIFILVTIITSKKILLTSNNKIITLNYSSFNFQEGEKSETRSKIESKEEEIIAEVKENKLESYDIFRDYCIMAHKGENEEYNKIPCFYYYDEIQNQYVVISKVDEQKYVEINVKAKENVNKNANEIFNKKEVQNVLKTLEIK